LNFSKFLANDLQISMVLVGTRDTVLALQTDTQMMSRYAPFEIPRCGRAMVCGGFSRPSNACCHCPSHQISHDARSFSLF